MSSTALVTGGAKRIGKHIALFLAQKGYDIVLHYNKSKSEAEAVQQEIQSLGKICSLVQANLSDLNDAQEFITTVMTDHQDLSVLVNNASIFEKSSIQDTDNQMLVNEFTINFFSPFILTREFAKKCKKGIIINLTDVKIFKDTSDYAAYTLSKKKFYRINQNDSTGIWSKYSL